MTERPTRMQDEGASEALEFDEGRYLFCIVFADEDDTFSAEGIEEKPVSLLVEDGIGAVVQPVESVYDSDDLTRVRQWLLTHQKVIDEAGEAFGTPLPFRFDTIFKGGDSAVSEWLRDNRNDLADALDWLAGRWEYRIEIRWDEQRVRDDLRTEKTQLQELSNRIENASSGTEYLLESQLEKQLAEQLTQRREQLRARLIEDIEPYADEIQQSPTKNSVLSEDTEFTLDTAVKLSVLAERENEEAIGEQLEPFAEQYDVRYTGPWPPYSHAPEIGGNEQP